jgi:hypothetical protein
MRIHVKNKKAFVSDFSSTANCHGTTADLIYEQKCGLGSVRSTLKRAHESMDYG